MKKVAEYIWNIINNIVSCALWELIRNILIPAIFIGTLNYYNSSLILVIVVSIIGIINLSLFIERYKKVEFKYIFLKREIYFEYCEDFSIYTISCKAKAMCNGVDRYYSRYTWDPEKVDMTCVEPSNSYIVPHRKNDIYHKYDMVFGGRKYNTGEKYDIKIESIMKGELQFPLFATTIIKPIKLLVIHIKLPTHLLSSKKIRCVISPSPSEIGIQQTLDKMLDNNGEYIWKIKNPKLSYEYCIEWDFTPSKAAIFNKE